MRDLDESVSLAAEQGEQEGLERMGPWVILAHRGSLRVKPRDPQHIATPLERQLEQTRPSTGVVEPRGDL
jgi:hypothetical protein